MKGEIKLHCPEIFFPSKWLTTKEKKKLKIHIYTFIGYLNLNPWVNAILNRTFNQELSKRVVREFLSFKISKTKHHM